MVNKAWPSFPIFVKGEIQKNPSLNVQYRGYQFPQFIELDGTYSAEFSSSGHGPFNYKTQRFLESSKFTVNESLDFCASHFRIDDNNCFCYFIQVPAWLAVTVDSESRVFFRFTHDLTVHDSDSVRTRFVLYHRFAFIDSDVSVIPESNNLFDPNTCIILIVDHNLLSNDWTIASNILTGFARFALD